MEQSPDASPSNLSPGGGRTKRDRDDESIMNTNNSCIVSKRSVEKIYHGEDQGFLRYFVKKFQRRSPLINRGYWLRMRAVVQAVQDFLQTHRDQPAVVMNLGCGYDTLPFKLLSREAYLCRSAKFVDVDYDALLQKKCGVIRQTGKLRKLCPETSVTNEQPNVLFESEQYIAIAADLQSMNDLRDLQQAVALNDRPVLFLAEVSMTYMEPDAVTEIIRWASSFGQAEFVLLEQNMPDGHSNQFAVTMINHFNKLRSPLKSALRFPSLEDQRKRFSDNGWASVTARSLWSLWSDNEFLDCNERRAMDAVEPFDEWEEFMLFSAHYFILTARVKSCSDSNDPSGQARITASSTTEPHLPSKALTSKYIPFQPNQGVRRNGAGVILSKSEVLHHGGFGPKGRLSNVDIFVETSGAEELPSVAEMPRQYFSHEVACHTLTLTKLGTSLLVGGRKSPNEALQACYLESRGAWTRVEDLPSGRYRHTAVPFEDGVLVIGGRQDSKNLMDDWLYWENGKGWNRVNFIGEQPETRFGACATSLSSDFTQATQSQSSAFLIGGMSADRKILSDVWHVDLIFMSPEGAPLVRCWQPSLRIRGVPYQVSGFGGAMTEQRGSLWVVGGIGGHGYSQHAREIIRIDKNYEVSNYQIAAPENESIPRPLLVGHQIIAIDKENLMIIGGGATCFSFGAFWNRGLYIVATQTQAPPPKTWTLRPPPKNGQSIKHYIQRDISMKGTHEVNPDSIAVPRVQLHERQDFEALLAVREPAILEDLSIGKCVERWDTGYLKHSIGENRPITVHVAESSKMNFLDKNFTYVKKDFGKFINDVSDGRKEYMRAISSTKPKEKATRLNDDFHSISSDFQLPPELAHVSESEHSSPLRISGPVTMWLHYDVMSNVLCQIRGTKHILLYAPWDADKLEFPPGASSSQLDAWDEWDVEKSSLRYAQAFEAKLQPGDVLYIPALWSHTAAPTEGMSIAVNVFFRDLDEGYAAGKDVYGNRDVQAYENGRKDIERIVKTFAKLPSQFGQFYLQRLAKELSDAAQANAEQGSASM